MCSLGLALDLGHAQAARDGSRTVRGLGLDLLTLSFFFFFFFFSDVLGSSLRFIRVINRVLET